MRLNELTCHELHQLLVKGEVSSQEITQAVFQQIAQVEDRIHAYITLTEDLAREQAKRADEKIRKGETIHPLTGIPMAIKDIICIEGIRTTCGSKILCNFVPPYDATIIKKLKAIGSVFVGKTNLDEFAFGSSTETSYFGITRNPWNLERIPGGSSGGSAAAVAAHETVLSLGTDTGGSIRQPAACCGVVGLKPTYGRVSRCGLVAFASSLDQIGPITKDVTDAALVLNVISGHDPYDTTSVDLPVPDYTKYLINDARRVRIGIPKEYFIEGMDSEVERAVEEAIKLLESLGAICEEISLPHTEYCVADYYLLATAEASSNLARFDGVQYGYRATKAHSLMEMYEKTRGEGFGAEAKRRIMLGTHALSSGYYEAYYLKALKVRTLIKGDFDRAFEKYDCLITPTAPTPAFKIGEKIDNPLQMYLSDIFTISVNLAGIAGISIPCGFSREGLPIGLQILSKPFGEEILFRVAYTYEQNTEWHLRKPLL